MESIAAPASPYLTSAEAAGYLRTTIQGVYSLVKRRKIKPMPGRPGRLLFSDLSVCSRRFRSGA